MPLPKNYSNALGRVKTDEELRAEREDAAAKSLQDQPPVDLGPPDLSRFPELRDEYRTREAMAAHGTKRENAERATAALILSEMSPMQAEKLRDKCPETAARVAADLQTLIVVASKHNDDGPTPDQFNQYLATCPPRWEGRPGRDPFLLREGLSPQRKREFKHYLLDLLAWDERTDPAIWRPPFFLSLRKFKGKLQKNPE